MRGHVVHALQLSLAFLLVVFAAAGRAEAVPGKAGACAPLTPDVSSRVLVRVLDTESSLGPMAKTPQEVTLADLVRFHGHPCDGLVACVS